MERLASFVGIDLGSTTTKAVYLDERGRVLGRGITNSRSNYELACSIAREEAGINSRFGLLHGWIAEQPELGERANALLAWLSSKFKLSQHLRQLVELEKLSKMTIDGWDAPWPHDSADPGHATAYQKALDSIFVRMREQAFEHFAPGVAARSDFFRDIASSQFLEAAEEFAQDDPEISFDRLVGVFDRAILLVESRNFSAFDEHLAFACEQTVQLDEFKPFAIDIQRATDYAAGVEFDIVNVVGTGYGRATLPFEKRQIRSEILCHGLGAHHMFPDTRTVLDIGGQDTKAIQVDGKGIVTNFQMNDRCAAGCGRYLGYIADEMNMGVHELGPLALRSEKTIRINSTCTVFAGAELRERLALGERREDILAGLHRAIILRALSLLARSGGVRNEFTFTGGVAKNQAATTELKKLIVQSYGDLTMNISPESIYTGALGAALFADRDREGRLAEFEMKKLNRKAPNAAAKTEAP